MQHLVGEFMDKRAELLGCTLTGKDGDSAAVANSPMLAQCSL